MTRISGNLIYHFREIYKKKFGNESLNEVLKLCSKETKNCFQGVIVSSDMYDLNYYREILDVVITKHSKEELENIIEKLAEQQLSGIFGFIVRLVTTKLVLSKTQILWDKAYSQGTVEKADFSPNKFILIISNFHYSEGHLIATIPYFKRWLEITEKKPVIGKGKRINDTTTEFIYTF